MSRLETNHGQDGDWRTGAARPQYVPQSDLPPPAAARQRRSAAWALLATLASVVAVTLAVVGVLLPAAGVHLPFGAGGPRLASWGAGPASPTPTPTAADASTPPVQADSGAGPSPSPTPDPGPPASPPAPGDAPAATDPPAGADWPPSASPTPPPPVPPPTGEPSPTPGTTWKTSAFDVPSGAARAPFVHGKLIWYNRSVGVSAVLSTTSSCASAIFTGYAGTTEVSRIATGTRCGTFTVSQNLNGRTVVGGITKVIVAIYVSGVRIGRDSCLRSTAVCTRD